MQHPTGQPFRCAADLQEMSAIFVATVPAFQTLPGHPVAILLRPARQGGNRPGRLTVRRQPDLKQMELAWHAKSDGETARFQKNGRSKKSYGEVMQFDVLKAAVVAVADSRTADGSYDRAEAVAKLVKSRVVASKQTAYTYVDEAGSILTSMDAGRAMAAPANLSDLPTEIKSAVDCIRNSLDELETSALGVFEAARLRLIARQVEDRDRVVRETETKISGLEAATARLTEELNSANAELEAAKTRISDAEQVEMRSRREIEEANRARDLVLKRTGVLEEELKAALLRVEGLQEDLAGARYDNSQLRSELGIRSGRVEGPSAHKPAGRSKK